MGLGKFLLAFSLNSRCLPKNRARPISTHQTFVLLMCRPLFLVSSSWRKKSYAKLDKDGVVVSIIARGT